MSPFHLYSVLHPLFSSQGLFSKIIPFLSVLSFFSSLLDHSHKHKNKFKYLQLKAIQVGNKFPWFYTLLFQLIT